MLLKPVISECSTNLSDVLAETNWNLAGLDPELANFQKLQTSNKKTEDSLVETLFSFSLKNGDIVPSSEFSFLGENIFSTLPSFEGVGVIFRFCQGKQAISVHISLTVDL